MWVLHYFLYVKLGGILLMCSFVSRFILFLKGPKYDRNYAYLCHLPIIMLIASLSDLFSRQVIDATVYLYI